MSHATTSDDVAQTGQIARSEADAAKMGQPIFEDVSAEETLILDLDGYEGPMHVLLQLAQTQKVDLRHLSILALADQYLAFVAKMRANSDAFGGRIDLAADYLVMAAWLTFLKSRLLLPKAERPKDEMAPETLAQGLAWQLRRLEAMKRVGNQLMALSRDGLDTFRRLPDAQTTAADDGEIPLWQADLLELLRAYGAQRQKKTKAPHQIKPWPVWQIDEARDLLRQQLSAKKEWQDLLGLVPPDNRFGQDPPSVPSRYAALFSAALELTKQGEASIEQLAPFDSLFVRAGPIEKANQ